MSGDLLDLFKRSYDAAGITSSIHGDAGLLDETTSERVSKLFGYIAAYQKEVRRGVLAKVPAAGRASRPQERSRRLFARAGTGASSAVTWTISNEEVIGGATRENAILATVRMGRPSLDLTIGIRRNADASIPAEQIVDVVVEKGSTVNGKGIASVGSLSAHVGPDDVGEELMAFPFEIAPGHFVLTLSGRAPSRERNLELLDQGAWLELAFILSDGEEVSLMVEKGSSGASVVARTLAEWGSATSKESATTQPN